MEKINANKHIDNEVLIRIENLCNKLDNVAIDVFDTNVENIVFVNHNNHTEAVLKTNKQIMIDDITDLLDEKLGVNIIHADCSYDRKNFLVVGFANEAEDNMFVVYMFSTMYGAIDEVYVDFYSSMDILFTNVVDVYNQTAERLSSFKQLERISQEQILETFNISIS